MGMQLNALLLQSLGTAEEGDLSSNLAAVHNLHDPCFAFSTAASSTFQRVKSLKRPADATATSMTACSIRSILSFHKQLTV